MPISFFSGQPRAGKTYQCVLNFIVPAIRAGRRVVSNVDGLNEDEIRDFIDRTGGLPAGGTYGEIVKVRADDVEKEDFFPEEKDPNGGFVKPGDVLAFDEVSTIFPSGEKMTKRTLHFLAYHGHYVGNGRSTDIGLIAQSIDMVPRKVRDLVAFHYRVRRLVALGMPRRYDLLWYEGGAIKKEALIGSERKRFDPRVFKLFASSHGGGANAVVQSDKRLVIWRRPSFWMPFLVAGALLSFGTYRLVTHGIVPGLGPHASSPAATHYGAVAPGASAHPSPVAAAAPAAPVGPPVPRWSDKWRVVGVERVRSVRRVVLEGPAGVLRAVSDATFSFDGDLPVAGTVDGQAVSTFSGSSDQRAPLSSVLR